MTVTDPTLWLPAFANFGHERQHHTQSGFRALTNNWSPILQIPQQYKSLTTKSTKDAQEESFKLINELIACDDFEDIATLKVRCMNVDVIKYLSPTR